MRFSQYRAFGVPEIPTRFRRARDPDFPGPDDVVAEHVAEDFLRDGHADVAAALFQAVAEAERKRGREEALWFPDGQEQAVDLQVLRGAAPCDDRVLLRRFAFGGVVFRHFVHDAL